MQLDNNPSHVTAPLIERLHDAPDLGGTLSREQVSMRAQKVRKLYLEEIAPKNKKVETILSDIAEDQGVTPDALEEHFWVRVTRAMDDAKRIGIADGSKIPAEQARDILLVILEMASRDYVQKLELGAQRLDPLTHLLLRRGWTAEAQKILEAPKGSVAFFFIDLNKFKAVNDTLGHAAGDAILEELGSRLNWFKSKLTMEMTGYRCLPGRWGGDEFILGVEFPGTFGSKPDDEALERIKAMLEKILFEAPIEIPIKEGAQLHKQEGAVGVVLARQNMNLKDLVDEADRRMYTAKANPR